MVSDMVEKIKENIPEVTFDCTADGCCRKFETAEKLKNHIVRRHYKKEEKD